MEHSWSIRAESRMWYAVLGERATPGTAFRAVSAVRLTFWKDNRKFKVRDQGRLSYEAGTKYVGGPYVNQVVLEIGFVE